MYTYSTMALGGLYSSLIPEGKVFLVEDEAAAIDDSGGSCLVAAAFRRNGKRLGIPPRKWGRCSVVSGCQTLLLAIWRRATYLRRHSPSLVFLTPKLK